MTTLARRAYFFLNIWELKCASLWSLFCWIGIWTPSPSPAAVRTPSKELFSGTCTHLPYTHFFFFSWSFFCFLLSPAKAVNTFQMCFLLPPHPLLLDWHSHFFLSGWHCGQKLGSTIPAHPGTAVYLGSILHLIAFYISASELLITAVKWKQLLGFSPSFWLSTFCPFILSLPTFLSSVFLSSLLGIHHIYIRANYSDIGISGPFLMCKFVFSKN